MADGGSEVSLDCVDVSARGNKFDFGNEIKQVRMN